MKNTLFNSISILLCTLLFIACSTKRNSFLARNNHALSTKYNILYNGDIALAKGIEDLKTQYKDNFWAILPVERMQILQESAQPNQTKNANFDRAETKATKAIQRHSMNIDGTEKNFQIDEAHLLLGQARYYDQRFIPALEAFNYVLYKYPTSSKIYEAKIWREKTNMRLDNDALAVTNLNKLLKEIKFKDQIFADANATIAQAFLNLQEKDSAVAKLKLATKFTKRDEEKARYHFILGQLYDDLNYKDSAFIEYQKVIDMNRKASRMYVIQAHAKQASRMDLSKTDTIAFLKKFTKLLKDRENRPYLDILNHQMGLYFDKSNQTKTAKKYYATSLKKQTNDDYLIASNYKNLAAIYFNKAQYTIAGKYYDSTLTKLQPRTREFNLFTKKKANLADVIKYETIAQTNDSLLLVTALSLTDKQQYYQKFIDKLKKQDAKIEKERLIAEKIAAQQNAVSNTDFKEKSNLIQTANSQKTTDSSTLNPTVAIGAKNAAANDFYFYNSSSVSYGKLEFKRLWGNRPLAENWRLNTSKDVPIDTNASTETATEKTDKKEENEAYTTAFYIKKLPISQKTLDSLAIDRNFAYYQLGTIYKEKFKEYALAANKLEKLLNQNPEMRLILPSLYTLYKIYEIIGSDKATALKEQIISKYPDSRYAQILKNLNGQTNLQTKPEEAYTNLFTDYQNGRYRELIASIDAVIDQFTGEELLVKFELLKANCIGKLQGVNQFKKALNYVALTYPNSFEGKETELFLSTKIPYLESLSFTKETNLSWKIIFPIPFPEDSFAKIIIEKLTKFVKERTIETLTTSNDLFTIDKNFLVIHGIKTEESAKGIASVLKEYKEYKITNLSYVISSDNYKVLQIKKNFDEYISNNWITNTLKPSGIDIKNQVTPEPDITKNKTPQVVAPLNTNSENNIPPAVQKLMDAEKNKTETVIKQQNVNPMFGEDPKK